MSFNSILLVVQFLAALAIIVLVLLQQGKGADMGSSFGSGSAGSLFGASGAANFLSRTTKWAAVVFFAATIGLAYASHSLRAGSSGSLNSGVMKGFEAAAPKNGDVPANQGAEVPGINPKAAEAPAAKGADVPAAGGAATNAAAPKADDSVPTVPAK